MDLLILLVSGSFHSGIICLIHRNRILVLWEISRTCHQSPPDLMCYLLWVVVSCAGVVKKRCEWYWVSGCEWLVASRETILVKKCSDSDVGNEGWLRLRLWIMATLEGWTWHTDALHLRGMQVLAILPQKISAQGRESERARMEEESETKVWHIYLSIPPLFVGAAISSCHCYYFRRSARGIIVYWELATWYACKIIAYFCIGGFHTGGR